MVERTRVLIVGAGGHGQVVADILLLRESLGGDLRPLGYLDDDVRLAGQITFGLPVLGTVADAGAVEHDAIVVAIGENNVRQGIFDSLGKLESQFVSAVHPTAVVARQVELGQGTVICAGAIVNPGCRVGNNVILNTGCIVEHHNHIADHVHIGPGACLGGGVQVGTGTLVGLGAVIMPGIQIGDRCVIGAGAVVTRDIGDNVVVAGNPARTIRLNAAASSPNKGLANVV